jgi:hypothetical protein
MFSNPWVPLSTPLFFGWTISLKYLQIRALVRGQLFKDDVTVFFFLCTLAPSCFVLFPILESYENVYQKEEVRNKKILDVLLKRGYIQQEWNGWANPMNH